jgi:hypothetical protein
MVDNTGSQQLAGKNIYLHLPTNLTPLFFDVLKQKETSCNKNSII